MKTISVDLGSNDSINNAVEELRAYAKKVKENSVRVLDEVSEIGRQEAFTDYSVGCDYYDMGRFNISLKKVTKYSRVLEAKGDNVMFLEFGTGINTADDYGNEVGFTFVFPGSYSQTVGAGNFKPGIKENWHYRHRKYTGTEATKGLYLSVKEMKKRAEEVAREVFK